MNHLTWLLRSIFWRETKTYFWTASGYWNQLLLIIGNPAAQNQFTSDFNCHTELLQGSRADMGDQEDWDGRLGWQAASGYSLIWYVKCDMKGTSWPDDCLIYEWRIHKAVKTTCPAVRNIIISVIFTNMFLFKLITLNCLISAVNHAEKKLLLELRLVYRIISESLSTVADIGCRMR
jgi:hypothetical protein